MAKAATKKTAFRVHYRLSTDNERHTFDCDAKDVGDAHAQCRKHVKDKNEKANVFIDKVKVLGE